ncbi:lipopolysaccharide export system permease protein [Candidatus Kinetoplastibacterium desouzaii TCC079E]|uniref:Lipopolysaccharide export system permease protein n=1 Tax=Candidatus Kinetoplastidibacterium desouzai TCC079E TaxID=1208919 RepID=M1LUL1_9PROT|nr:LptF/LptG family permease [Candidatus Kinetoplastibacterium desouzaii]AGF46999.1 lipopolysaccharide export system permease protein [Candidatus Kinetoplastibacterium desouzaii TCC079E]
MSIFQKSIISEIYKRFVLVLFVLVMVWFSIIVVRILGDSFLRNFPINVVCLISILSVITSLPVLLSISLFMAIVSTIARCFKDLEMIIWFSSGLSLKDWFSPVFQISFPISIIVLVFSFFLSPIASNIIDNSRDSYLRNFNSYNLSKGHFIEPYYNNKLTFYSDSNNQINKTFNNVFINFLINDNELTIITAESLELTTSSDNEQVIVMNHVSRNDFSINNLVMKSFSSEKCILYLDHLNSVRTRNENFINKKVLKGYSTSSLFSNGDRVSWSYIIWRISIPIATLNLAFLGISLGVLCTKYDGKFNYILISMLLGLFYINMIGLCQSLVIKEQLDIYESLIYPHLLFF